MIATQSILTRGLDVLWLSLAGAITAAVLFAFCWLGTLVPCSSPTHAYISLFTPAEIDFGAALAQGLCWSFLFGGLSGAVLAIVYNLLGSLEMRIVTIARQA